MDKEFQLIYLPKKEFPDPKIQRQLARMHVEEGLIYDTYRACIDGTREYRNEDIIFDKVLNHWAFYIIEKQKPEKVIAWGIVIKGRYTGKNQDYIVGHYFTRPKYRGYGLGTMLFKESVKISHKNKDCPILVYPCNSNKWYFKKMKDRFPEANVQNVYKVEDEIEAFKKKAGIPLRKKK